MKKIIALVSALLLIVGCFSACSLTRANTVISQDDADFRIYRCICNPLDGINPSRETTYKVITTYNDFNELKQQVASEYQTEYSYEGDNAYYKDDSFNKVETRFTEAYFENYDLIVIKRYHGTAKPLIINTIDVNGEQISVSASLEDGGEVVGMFRMYFIRLSKGLCTKKSQVSINVTSSEATTSEFDGKSFISKEYNYKLIDDQNYADKIVSMVKSYNLVPASKPCDTGDYGISTNDCLFVTTDFSMMITANYIIINDVQYEPNEELRKKIVSAYDSLNAEIHKEDPPEYDTDTTTAVS